MGIGSNRAAIALALGVSMALTGCAGGSGATKTPLEAAERACEKAMRPGASAPDCDRYVALAEQSGNKDKIFSAYSYRAMVREFSDDLPGAIADADKAVAAWPDSIFAHRRRAALMGENGDYEGALRTFADFQALDPTNAFDETLAMLEYVTGDRAKAVPLFQSAARDYAEGDLDEDTAASHRFRAALIESELRGGDLTPIAGQDVSSRTETMLPNLWRHRMGEMTDAELLAQIERMTGPAARDNACEGYFSIGHRNALAGDSAAAKQGFRSAVDRCHVVTFEYHAAKAWLKLLEG